MHRSDGVPSGFLCVWHIQLFLLPQADAMLEPETAGQITSYRSPYHHLPAAPTLPDQCQLSTDSEFARKNRLQSLRATVRDTLLCSLGFPFIQSVSGAIRRLSFHLHSGARKETNLLRQRQAQRLVQDSFWIGGQSELPQKRQPERNQIAQRDEGQ